MNSDPEPAGALLNSFGRASGDPLCTLFILMSVQRRAEGTLLGALGYCSARKEERTSGHAFPTSSQSKTKILQGIQRTAAHASTTVVTSGLLDESTLVLQNSQITVEKSSRVRIRNDTLARGLELCFRDGRPIRGELIKVMGEPG